MVRLPRPIRNPKARHAPHASRRALLGLACLAALAACAPQGEEAPAPPSGHVLRDEGVGFALDLPPIWAGRYALTDSVTAPAPGLAREFTLRFVRADSQVVREPLAVLRVFAAASWNAIPADSAGARYGAAIAGNGEQVLVIAAAPSNPLPAGTADALGFDSLMIALNQRPLRAWLRREGQPGRGADASPGTP